MANRYLCDYTFVLEEYEAERKSFPTFRQINFKLYFTEIISFKKDSTWETIL